MRFNEFYDQQTDEMIGVKKYQDMDIVDATDAIANAMGTKVLGNGAFGRVIQSPNPNIIYKVFEKDDAYLTFIDYARKHPNVHFPKILKIKSMTSFFKRYEVQADKFYVVAIEKLYPISSVNYAGFLAGFVGLKDLTRKPMMLPDGNFNNQALTGYDILKDHPELQSLWDAGQLIRKDLMKIRGMSWDLHRGNFMQREDGTVVITDPITNDDGFKYLHAVSDAASTDQPMIKGPKYALKRANQVNTIDSIKKRVAELEAAIQSGQRLDAEDNMVLSVFKRFLKKHQANDNVAKDKEPV